MEFASKPLFSFPDFVAKFPPVEMPVTLGEDTHHVFSSENELLPDAMVQQFIAPIDGGLAPDDEFTEYLPCFAIEDAGPFIALVWWKAELMNYEYVLATFDTKGRRIDHRVIAFTRVESGNRIRRAVATLDADLDIFIAEGAAGGEREDFDPTSSKTYTLEILADGSIV